jgi:hypothetical protein
MKIDVEGFESEVLKGASGLLQNFNVFYIIAGEDMLSCMCSAALNSGRPATSHAAAAAASPAARYIIVAPLPLE